MASWALVVVDKIPIIDKFKAGLRAEETKESYPRLVGLFFDFLDIPGTLEEQFESFVKMANDDDDEEK